MLICSMFVIIASLSLHKKTQNMTKTHETQKIYMNRATKILDRYSRETGMAWNDDPGMFCNWFLAMKPEWKPSTWRQYKASICYFMEQLGPVEIVRYLKSQTAEGCNKDGKTAKTSSQKQKHFKHEDLIELTTFLAKGKSRYNNLLAMWLILNIQLGLRPSEWETAKLDGHQLIVQNGKNTNNRSHGQERRILLSDAPDNFLELLKEFLMALDRAVSAKGSFQIVYELLRKKLYKANYMLWPRRKKRPTLYSTRHQFSADLKKSNYSLTEIAALFGHATDETATFHYGRKQHGKRGSSFVKANPEEIGRIRQVYSGRPQNKNAPTLEEGLGHNTKIT